MLNYQLAQESVLLDRKLLLLYLSLRNNLIAQVMATAEPFGIEAGLTHRGPGVGHLGRRDD